MTKEELRERLSELIRQKGQVYLVGGALGDMQGCNAYVEETIRDGMWKTKYLGVSYWFKGITDNDIIDRVTITKRAIKEMLSLFPIRIGKIISAMWMIYTCEGGLKSRVLKQENFCSACQELIETGLESAARIPDEENRLMIKDLIFCFAMFLQFSTSYRAYVQDILGELDKDKFVKSPLRETLRLKKIFMKRIKLGKSKIELLWKSRLEFLWRIIFLVVLFNKKKAMKFIEELDISKTKMDYSDWYYVLRRGNYDFGGIPISRRLKIAEIIDEECGNIVLGI